MRRVWRPGPALLSAAGAMLGVPCRLPQLITAQRPCRQGFYRGNANDGSAQSARPFSTSCNHGLWPMGFSSGWSFLATPALRIQNIAYRNNCQGPPDGFCGFLSGSSAAALLCRRRPVIISRSRAGAASGCGLVWYYSSRSGAVAGPDLMRNGTPGPGRLQLCR